MNPFVKFWSLRRILKKGRLVGCLILVALVMAPLVCALIFSESMIEGITNKYIYLSDGHIQVSNTTFDTENISSNEMILSADQVITGYGLMYSATGTSSVTIKGVASSYFNEDRLAQVTFETTELEKSNLKGIAISRYTANKLKVEIGDRVALMIVPDTANAVPRPILVRIEAIFHSGYDQLDQILAFVDVAYAKTLFTAANASSFEILVQPEYMERLNEVVSSLEVPIHYISTWDQHNLSVYTNFITSKQMILIILLLVVVVAAFYTSSVAHQMIQDDIKPISIAKLIGMSDSMVRKSVFLSVCLVTFVGMVLGIILGISIGYLLGPVLSKLSNIGLESLSFYLLDFDVHIPWASVLLISACLLLLSNVAVWLTLRKTRQITPIQLFSNS